MSTVEVTSLPSPVGKTKRTWSHRMVEVKLLPNSNNAVISVFSKMVMAIKPITAFKMRFIRRYFKWFSTILFFSCCYVMLFKSSEKSNPLIQDVLGHQKSAENELFNPFLPEEKVVAESYQPIVYLPKVTTPSMDLNRTLNWLDLWSNDTFCNQFYVHLLEENSIQPRALVSFPGSGNTWLRMLIMGVTGLYVDTVYPSDEFFYSKAGSTFELKKNCNCTLLQKTHDFTLFSVLYNAAVHNKTGESRLRQEIEEFHGDGILVIRNPFKAILSYRNFAFGGNMQGMAPSLAFSQELKDVKLGGRRISTWDTFITRSIATWELLATIWIKGLKRGGVLYYEKLRRETGPQLIRLTQMLGIESVSQDRLNCVLRHNQDNTFKRSESGHNYPENPFTESQHLLILKSIEAVQKALKERGLDPLPVELYEFYTPMYEYGISDNSR